MNTKHKAPFEHSLDAKVEARNNVNAEAMRLSKETLAKFAPLVGAKIASVNGGLIKKYEHLKPKGNINTRDGWPAGTFTVCNYSGYKSFGFTVRTVEHVKGKSFNGQPSDYCTASYADATFTVGELDNEGRLVKLWEPFKARTDYDADEVRRLRKEASELENKVREIKAKFAEFGGYDQ